MLLVRVPQPWYRPEDYARIRAVMDDPDNFPDSYDDWLRLAEQHAGEFARHGVIGVRVMIEPAEFAAFCRDKGVKPDLGARMMFAVANADLVSAAAPLPSRLDSVAAG